VQIGQAYGNTLGMYFVRNLMDKESPCKTSWGSGSIMAVDVGERTCAKERTRVSTDDGETLFVT